MQKVCVVPFITQASELRDDNSLTGSMAYRDETVASELPGIIELVLDGRLASAL